MSTPAEIQTMPKVLNHEHLDCSLRPRTVLELASKIGFDKFATLAFPAQTTSGWLSAQTRQEQEEVAAQYQHIIAEHASSSLANYVAAVVHHLLPVMQTACALERITSERIEDALADGIIAMDLRFAPQLHTAGGLSLQQVMDAVLKPIQEAPIPVSLSICVMRHNNEDMAHNLANLAIEYRQHVGKFDLAGDEQANPGVLDWWLQEALRVQDHGITPTLHIGETNNLSECDLALIAQHKITEVGHGFLDEVSKNFVRTLCITSNVVTGQVPDFASHPVDRLYREGVSI